jgi:hypothetical protein
MNLGGTSYSGNTNSEAACTENCGGNTVGLWGKRKNPTDDQTNFNTDCTENCG